jgi:predicted ATP-grasp superfamily ATP-dependent carboligase
MISALALLVLILDVNGVQRHPLRVDPSGKANALFFVTNECPISNGYAHEISRICADYKSKGIACIMSIRRPPTSRLNSTPPNMGTATTRELWIAATSW